MLKFQLKFIDIMVGVVLGLGFQWWPELREPWQYIAFVFAYLNLIDYWIDYNPIAKRYPLRHELTEVLIHTLIIFGMFLLVFGSQKTLPYFLYSFAFYRLADILWIWRMKKEHTIPHHDMIFMNTWHVYDAVEMFSAIAIGFAAAHNVLGPTSALLIFIVIRVATRIASSTHYKKVFFAV